MVVFEYKLKGKSEQYRKVDEAIRTGQFIRNSCLKYWQENRRTTKNDLQKYCAVLARNPNFPWAKKLNSQARQAHADRAWFAISRFFENCKNKAPGKKGYPKFKKNSHSVEYKSTGWKLSEDRKRLTLTDGFAAGTFKLVGSRYLHFYPLKTLKRIRIIKRADGYYVQFLIDTERNEKPEYTGSSLGIDVGLASFYTDSNGQKVDNPRYLRKSERQLKRLSKRMSRRYRNPNKGKKGEKISKTFQKQSNRFHKARIQVARQHLGVRCDSLRVNHGIKSVHNLSWQTVTTQDDRTLGLIRVQAPSARLRYDSLSAHTDQTRFLESEAGNRTQSDIRCGMTLALTGSSYGENRALKSDLLKSGAQHKTPTSLEPHSRRMSYQ